MGNGPILRVGDRASAFTPAATAHCHRVARELAASDKTFRYQRKLMDGGTCESSAFCALGYDATGICVALGNYHNVDAKRGKLGMEYIDLDDFDNVVKWFVELARSSTPFTGEDSALLAQLKELQHTYRALLRSSVKTPK
jgi:endoglucanase